MINIALAGTGNISRMHLEGYGRFPGRCKVTALADINPAAAEQRKKEYPFLGNAKIYASHKDMLAAEDIDIVDICSPPFCHAEIAVDSLNAGRHVILEKPMAASLGECDAVIAAAEKSGTVLSVIAQNRFRGEVNKLKQTLDTGKIGKILHAQVDSFWWRGHSYYDLWWRGAWEKEGGGCTLNHAVHHIDMLGWMMGLPVEVCAIISNAAHDNAEVEDISAAVMRYTGGVHTAEGALAQVTSSVIHHGEEQQLVFQGEKARISFPWRVAAHIAQPNGFPAKEQNEALIRELDDFYRALPDLPYSGHTAQIDNVLTAVETGGQPLIGGLDGRLTIELITAIYKAGIERRTVELPIRKDDAYYTTAGILRNAPRFYQKTSSAQALGGEIRT
ncbi:MAG: Gfo/Idh/MocA family oxidoreductase [Treponema sp.]|jgi:predicted dehydrogenase|nr:Gfo/Idh/MocA family oxidoreductase [Treponema sp.]